MKYTNLLIRDYSDPAFQKAFRQYFQELGVSVSNWDGLFAQMTDDGCACFIRRDEADRIIGFIQFSKLSMTSWFFEDRCGFVQEFWVAPECRRQGHGAALLAQTEEWFRRQGICRMILTTDTAEKFYLRHGYRRDVSIVAKNRAPVFVKEME